MVFLGGSVNKKISALILATLILAVLSPAWAQQPKRVPRIGFLGNFSGRDSAITPFRERLRELGYVEGQTITIESRYWEGKAERLPEVAAELVRLKCDVIFTTGNEAAAAAKIATKEIPT